MTCPIAQISIPKQDQTKNLRKKNGPDLDHHYLFSGRLEYSGQQGGFASCAQHPPTSQDSAVSLHGHGFIFYNCDGLCKP